MAPRDRVRPPLPKEEERKAKVKADEGSLGLPIRLEKDGAVEPPRHGRYQSVGDPTQVATSRRESEVATHSWPLEDEARSKRHLPTMFFLDPTQLLANIKAEEKKSDKEVALEDDEEEKVEEKDPRQSAAGTVPPMAKRSQKLRPDNEYIQVAVRIRPFLDRDRGERNVLLVEQNQITIERGTERKNSAESPLQSHRETGARAFKFDFVLDSRGDDPSFASQETVYEKIGERIVSCAIDGYNACLFAYGQTGAGKTHTVLGDVNSPEKRGLLPRVLEGLYAQLEQEKASLQISYLEIFNEQIYDLLVPPKVNEPRSSLQVRYHPSLGVMINDLTQSWASSIDEALELVSFGTRMRSIASTSMNHRSSRAHTVFTFRFEQTSKDETKMAQVQLVDLAGREQEKSSVDNKDRLKERQFINTSLFHLSTCIINLAKASKARKTSQLTDFAFRNSRLTLLLAHSLSGNSRTGMIAAVSPTSSDQEETISTLRFADMVKQIRTTVTSNRVNKANLIKQLQDEIARLKSQMEMNARCNADEQISQLEAVISHFKDALEQEKSRSKALAQERQACLQEMGLSVNTEGVSVVVGSDKDGVPYLVNLSEDPYLQGCLMYFLPGPEVTIGSADGNQVRMSGLGMKPYHCCICNEGNRRLTIHPISTIDEKDFPRVLLNGRPVTEKVEIHHQDRLILGHAWAFRLAVPLTASALREAENPELDQALAEIEDSSSQSFRHLRKYVEDLQRCAGPDEAKLFVRQLHKNVPLVDEANQITREVHIDLGFELQVLTDLWSTENLPEMVVAVLNTSRRGPATSATDVQEAAGVWQPMRRGRGELKFVWTFNKFLSRLQAMRDIYQEMSRPSGDSQAMLQRLENDALANPWLEFEENEIRMMMLSMKANSPEVHHRLVQGFPSPTMETRLMLQGYKSGTFGSVSDASLAMGVSPSTRERELESKSDELLAKSQFLLEGAHALLQQHPERKISHRSVVLEGLDPEEESRMQELELKVEEGMKKWQRMCNPSVASSFVKTKTERSERSEWDRSEWTSHTMHRSASSSENSFCIETMEAPPPLPRDLLRPPTMADTLSPEEALHAENSMLEREVEELQAEIEELKKQRALRVPRVPLRTVTLTPPALARTPRAVEGVATPVEMSPRLCAYVPGYGYTYAAPGPATPTPRVSTRHSL